MIKTPSQIVYEFAGSPGVEGAVEHEGEACWLCGGSVARGVPVRKWIGKGFSDHDRAAMPSSDTVCEACVFVCSRVAPVPGRPPGKCSSCEGTLFVTKVPKAGKASRSRKGDPCPSCDGTGMNKNGGSFRNYSHLWEDGICYGNASKGQKDAIRMFLQREHAAPWFAAIADSGQLHVLPMTPINGPGRAGRVLFDRVTVEVPRDVSMLNEMSELLTAGATKDEITRGDYGFNAWRLCEMQIRTFEDARARERGSGWFALCVWLAQRDEDEVKRRMAADKEAKDAKKRSRKTGTRRNRQRDPIPEQSVHTDDESQSSEALAEAPVSVSPEPERSRDSGPVAGGDPVEAPDYSRGEQISLF